MLLKTECSSWQGNSSQVLLYTQKTQNVLTSVFMLFWSGIYSWLQRWKNQRSTIRTFRFIASLVTDFGKMTGTLETGSTVYTKNSKCSYFGVFILFWFGIYSWSQRWKNHRSTISTFWFIASLVTDFDKFCRTNFVITRILFVVEQWFLHHNDQLLIPQKISIMTVNTNFQDF